MRKQKKEREPVVVGFIIDEAKRWRTPQVDPKSRDMWDLIVYDGYHDQRLDINLCTSRKRGSFINVYGITRHYGGPEEGGWWYDWYHLVKSVPIRNGKALNMRLIKLMKRYRWNAQGDISSVLGGEQVYIRLEQFVGESQSTERPHYE